MSPSLNHLQYFDIFIIYQCPDNWTIDSSVDIKTDITEIGIHLQKLVDLYRGSNLHISMPKPGLGTMTSHK